MAIPAFVLTVGAGHIVLGRPKRGAIWFGAMALSILLGPWVPYVALLLPLVWIAALVDTIRAPPAESLPPWRKTLRVTGAVIVVGLGLFIGVRASYVQGNTIHSASMEPTLSFNDHIFISKASYWFAGPERGEVVAFHYPCDPSQTFVQRVVAVAGDTIEVRCRRVYLNGKQLPLEPSKNECRYWRPIERGAQMEERTCERFTERSGGAHYNVVFDKTSDSTGTLNDFPRLNQTAEVKPPTCSTFTNAIAGAPTALSIRETKCSPYVAVTIPEGHLFVMGDNRDHSADSRTWGMVPIANVIGRATMIWWGGHKESPSRFGRIGSIE